jgi:transcription initiation factor TFIID subunit TAF12
LLEVADEFIEANAARGCRLAKHRRGNKLEVKDLQVHLGKDHTLLTDSIMHKGLTVLSFSLATERDSNIFIPGFAYEAIRVDQAPFLRKPQTASTRASRLAAVQQAKRDGGPIGKIPVKQAQQA